MKKLFASLFVAGLLLSSVVGCGGTPTTKAEMSATDKKKAAEKAVTDAEDALKKAEEALKAKPDDKDLKKAVEDAKDALDKAKKALKAL